ncbi:hypothetical protein BCE75_102105 [Isoptericola sp. CG 20/1183]|uniref:Aromatic acid exporter family member 1 n=1 Tax=Isoptericola halotolerans TaxID=300560 RepID=A0ABX5EIQ5_9MICO|nr:MULTISPECIES: hypothetical protein [Isoptericola]PRZ09397.1 hypothetical protein BCE75_102105 [Isoptericola sp. CG 20/1183]PRZ10198.1 hypothetical protein BCL65_101337 [Isoptericola halotolerans]
MGGRTTTGPISTLHRTWLRQPRWSLAARGAIAAGIAWFVGVLAPAPLSEYPYYAPLGAVIATTSTLVRSVRDSLQVTAAVLAGAGIARAADAFLSPGAPSVAVVVGVSLLISGWRFFGEMGTWVATSAIFVLILGNADALEYVGSFAGLVAAGAVVGIGVNLAMPPLRLTPTEDALDRLSTVLADVTEDLANELDARQDPSVDDWNRRRHTLRRALDLGRDESGHTREAERGNPRVRRHRRWADGQQVRIRELETVVASVDQLASLLVDAAEPVELGDGLRASLVRALRGLVEVLRADVRGTERGPLVDRFEEAVQDFDGRFRREPPEASEELVSAASAVALHRAVAAFRG